MLRKSQYVAIGVMLVGLASLAMGIVFILQGQHKAEYMTNAMRQEQITLGLVEGEAARGEFVDTAKEAEIAGDLLREHRRSIAPTYGDLLGGERFDATDPEQLTYAQALNLENYLYLAVTGFGLTTVVIASGAFMIVTGLALGGTGAMLFRLARQPVRAS